MAFSTLFRVDEYFDFISINAKNTASHKCIVTNDTRKFRTISETVGNSALIPNQHS